MTEIECAIGLKVPDNTALSAFAALRRMGFSDLAHLARWNYYKFDIKEKADAFLKKISQVDTILNANKQMLMSPLRRYGQNQVFILVQDDLGESKLLEKLHKDWKLAEIGSVDHGILWEMQFSEKANAEQKAAQIAKALLVNENYQRFRIFR